MHYKLILNAVQATKNSTSRSPNKHIVLIILFKSKATIWKIY